MRNGAVLLSGFASRSQSAAIHICAQDKFMSGLRTKGGISLRRFAMRPDPVGEFRMGAEPHRPARLCVLDQLVENPDP
jgi:hypothetical protein